MMQIQKSGETDLVHLLENKITKLHDENEALEEQLEKIQTNLQKFQVRVAKLESERDSAQDSQQMVTRLKEKTLYIADLEREKKVLEKQVGFKNRDVFALMVEDDYERQ